LLPLRCCTATTHVVFLISDMASDKERKRPPTHQSGKIVLSHYDSSYMIGQDSFLDVILSALCLVNSHLIEDYLKG